MRPGRQQAETRALYLECARALKRAGAKDYEVAEILQINTASLTRWRRAGWIR